MFWQRKRPEQNPGVYRIRNSANGREYIGATTRSIMERWKTHRVKLNNNDHDNSLLQADWNTYGAAAFIFEVIEVVYDQRLVFERERVWQRQDYNREQRYNPPHNPGPKAVHSRQRRFITDAHVPFEMITFRNKNFAFLRPGEDPDFWLGVARLVFSGRVSEDDIIEVVQEILRDKGLAWTNEAIRLRLRREWGE